ncbi:uncharacterized protein [Halyomorpha halys]|uniref:uncharacterized protein n=1 Tax=Halyomorpha halys TaxID=286706 RepID=UPI0006D4F29C|nr:multicystatin-like [Halyomorpha halys]XP_014285794.1 multicystatin-like [Halyomorpha halys]
MGLNHFILLFSLGLINFSLGKQCVGCSKKIDIYDPTVYEYLIKKLHELKDVTPRGTINDKELELIEIKNAQQKIVAGILNSYQFEAKGLNTSEIYDCFLTVQKQPWLGSEKVTEFICIPISNRNIRLSPGAVVDIDVHNNTELEDLKSFIGQEIGKALHSEQLMTVVQYLKATLQEVEGTIIKTSVEVATTNCQINADTDCQHKLQGHQVCDVQVWLKPWMKFKEVTGVQCQPLQGLLGACAGCPKKMDPNSPFIKQSLEKTLDKHNKESQMSKKLTLVKINKATSQVIKGFRLTIYFDAKDVNSNNHSCKAVIILPASSSEEQSVEDFNCTPAN